MESWYITLKDQLFHQQVKKMVNGVIGQQCNLEYTEQIIMVPEAHKLIIMTKLDLLKKNAQN